MMLGFPLSLLFFMDQVFSLNIIIIMDYVGKSIQSIIYCWFVSISPSILKAFSQTDQYNKFENTF